MLRDLDVFLEFLQKFSFLEQLDLFGNPLAEEPDYRLKIIRAMPQIQILDRHKVTQIERLKANRAQAAQKQLPAISRKQTPRSAVVRHTNNKSAASMTMNGFSACERDLYAEVRQLREREWAQ